MTLHAGEYLEVWARATVKVGPDKADTEPLTDTDGVTAALSLWKPGEGEGPREKVLDDATLTFDQERQRWFLHWDTNGLPAGSYAAKVLFVGPGPHRSWEYGKIPLKANPDYDQPVQIELEGP